MTYASSPTPFEEHPYPRPHRARHRAERPQGRARKLVTRVSAAGATLALPLVGASMANAAGGDGDSYTVKSGDTLSRIADEQDVDGGWKALYEANKSTIGGDPDLLQAGDELTLNTDRAVRPVAGGTKTAEYQASGSNWSHGHTGTDIAVSTGTNVKAAVKGTVVTADWDNSFGNQVVIKHADGKYSHYAHLSKILVKDGQSVGAGDHIAESGSTGKSTGPHLHFEVRTTPEYGSAIDPAKWLAGYGVKL
ncbi:M23 family metallopeptidase [Streptomyces sp. NPDC048172]|uniref:M23 family metallopeptidase n=1 Tax=Streptomyces sp. NPDC048172 TaxID=3365505 RepID=UPI00371FF825